VIAATHDAELIELLAANYLPHYFCEAIADGRLTFDYRIRAGALAPRNALAVLELVGFPQDVLDESRRIARLRDSVV
jgi:DNA mismatch repair ATPase MutS